MSTLMLSSFIESTIVGLQLRAVDSQLSGKPTPIGKTDLSIDLNNDFLTYSVLSAQQRLTFAKRFPKESIE